MKSIAKVIHSQTVAMGNHKIEQPLPTSELSYLNPFLLIHHWKNVLPGKQHQREVGVGPHPHRGFSPVTFVFNGDIEHRDSLGNRAIVKTGGTQWMFAGSGLTHSERPSADMAVNGGNIEFIQFWVNVPAAHKMNAPYYKPISFEETPLYIEDGISVGVVSGEFKGIMGVAPTFTEQNLLRGKINAGKSFSFEISDTHNTLLYLLDGHLVVNNKDVMAKGMVVFEQKGTKITLHANKNTRFIVLSGLPINESVVSQGPFVMNTETEILEAYRDARMNKMGFLVEEF